MPNSNAATSARRPLLGLLTYSYLAAKNGLILIFSAATVMGILFLIGMSLGEGPLIRNWLAMILPLASLLLMAGPILSIASNSDSATGWSRYQAAMPVTRGHLVSSKFLSLLLGIAAATGIFLLIMAASYLIDSARFRELSEIGQWVTSGTMVIIAPLLTAAVYLPLASTNHSRGARISILLTCLIACFAGSQFLYAAISRFIFNYGTTPHTVFWTAVGTSILILLGSYLITRRMYSRASF